MIGRSSTLTLEKVPLNLRSGRVKPAEGPPAGMEKFADQRSDFLGKSKCKIKSYR